MLNWVEVVTLVTTAVIVAGFVVEGRLRQSGYLRVIKAIYISGVLWGWLLISTQRYVRPQIRVVLGVIALGVVVNAIRLMFNHGQYRKTSGS